MLSGCNIYTGDTSLHVSFLSFWLLNKLFEKKKLYSRKSRCVSCLSVLWLSRGKTSVPRFSIKVQKYTTWELVSDGTMPKFLPLGINTNTIKISPYLPIQTLMFRLILIPSKLPILWHTPTPCICKNHSFIKFYAKMSGIRWNPISPRKNLGPWSVLWDSALKWIEVQYHIWHHGEEALVWVRIRIKRFPV